MMTLGESIQRDRRLAYEAAKQAARSHDTHTLIATEKLSDLLDELDDLRSQVGSLHNAIDDAIDAVRLHESQARERKDTAPELEWRAQANALDRLIAEPIPLVGRRAA